jgi:lipopolysaccharide biosynthesis glycosyltransferase
MGAIAMGADRPPAPAAARSPRIGASGIRLSAEGADLHRLADGGQRPSNALKRDGTDTESSPMGAEAQSVTVVCGADDRYAMPLTVTLRSALDGLADDRQLVAYVIDGGIRPRNRTRMLDSLDPERSRVYFVPADPGAFSDAVVSPGHISVATYYRIAVPRLLPPEVERAIYLDSDLVVLGDLGALFDTDLDDRPLAATVDVAVPTVSAPFGLRNYRELGLVPDVPYFNAGVLAMDLDRWRRDDVTGRAFAYLKSHGDQIRFWDQDVLNAVLAGDFRTLDPRWNQLPFVFDANRRMPFGPDVLERLLSDPWIVHFATASKPWQLSCAHPRRDLFFAALDRTAWAGWRPRRTLAETRAGRAVTRLQRSMRVRVSRRAKG